MRAARTFKFAALAVAAGVALTACAGGAPQTTTATSEASDAPIDGEGRTLTVLVRLMAQAVEAQQEFFDGVITEFKEQTGADVTLETFAAPDEVLTKMQTAAVSGQGPDIFNVGADFIPTAYATNAFVTLSSDDWEKVGGTERFTESSLSQAGPDEEARIGVPFAGGAFQMAYNKELLAAAGIEEPATTWDELAEQAVLLTDPSIGQYGLAVGYKDNIAPWKFLWQMALQAGTPMVDGDTANIDNPEVMKAYETYFGWLTDDKVVDPASVGWTNSQALAAFAEGKAAYIPMVTSTSLPTLMESAVADKFEYALLPTTAPGEDEPVGDPVASLLSMDYSLIADYSDNKDLALAFIEILNSDEQAFRMHELLAGIPSNAVALEEVATLPHMETSTEAVKLAAPAPFTGAWGDFILALTNVVVQSIPDLEAGGVAESTLRQRIQEAEATAQSSLDRAQ